MKTITEFSGFVLKDAMAKKAALLGEGKTEEEAQSSINEWLKLDEAKGVLYKNVVDMTSSRVDRVKRVVVATKASETEKVPENYFEREGHFYLVEFFPDPNARAPSRHNDRDAGGGRGRSGPGRGGNDRGRGGGSDRRPPPQREERVETQASTLPRPEGAFKPRIEGAPAPVYAKKERAPRPPRGEKKPRSEPRERGAAPRGPKGAGELRLVLKGQSQTTLQGSGPAQAEATSVDHSTDHSVTQPTQAPEQEQAH